MALFDAYTAQLEDTIDSYYGEAITITPYKSGDYMSDPVADGSRQVVNAVGYPVLDKTAPQPQVLGGNMRVGDSPLRLKVQDKYMATVQKDDQVTFTGLKFNNLICTISYIAPSINGRREIHLLRNKT